jgi:hypothetical protein
MHETAPTWSTARELIGVIRPPAPQADALHHVDRRHRVLHSLPTRVILDGRATVVVWIKAALTYLTPLLVSNFGLLSATRRRLSSPGHRRGDEVESVITTNPRKS